MNNAWSLIGPWWTNHNEDITPNLIWESFRQHIRQTWLTNQIGRKTSFYLLYTNLCYVIFLNFW